MNPERAKHWAEIIRRQDKSGLSVKAFCRVEGLCAQSLYQWRRRLEERAAVSFAVVEVKPETIASRDVEVILCSSDRLRIPAGVDPQTLRTVGPALRERA
jgi:transposase-like protein